MDRRSLLATLGMTAVSGCLRVQEGNSSGDETTTTRSETTTATQTASQTTETTDTTETSEAADREPEYPLGLEENGVSETLRAVHRDTLEETSFRSNVKKINVDAGQIWLDRTYRYADYEAIGTRSFVGPITVYRAPNIGVWREELPSGYSYGVDTRGSYFGNVIDEGVMGNHFKAGDWGPPKIIQREFPGRFELTASRADNPDKLLEFHEDTAQIESYEGRMVVDERGFIRRMNTTRTWIEGGEEEIQQYVFTISSLGEVSVQRPTWIETARDQAPSVSVEFVDDRTLVRMVHESGNPIPPETQFNLEAGLDTVVGRTNSSTPIEAGDTVYLYRRTDGEMGLSTGSPPTDTSVTTLDANMLVKVHRGGLDYFDELSVAD